MGLIQKKQTKAPKTVLHQVRLSVDDIERNFCLRHLKVENNELVCAEGKSYYYYLQETADRVFQAEDTLFYYNCEKHKLIQANVACYTYTGLPLPHSVLPLPKQNGVKQWLVMTNNEAYLLKGNETFEKVADVTSTRAVIFKERVFTISRDVIRYSAPLDMQNWSEVRYGGGCVEIPASEGNFIGIVAFRDELYFFRERGIMRLDASGDDLDFKAVPIRFGGGSIVSGTIADCGDCIAFFTNRGFYTFDGSACKLQKQSRFEQMFNACSYGAGGDGRYMAQCSHVQFGTCTYCFDLQTGKGHFVFLGAGYMASGSGIWFPYGNGMYRISNQGDCNNGWVQLVSSALSDFGLGVGTKRLEAISVEGAGSYEISAKSECTTVHKASGEAGRKLCFSIPVYGKRFSLTISGTVPADMKIKSITLYFREVKNDD